MEQTPSRDTIIWQGGPSQVVNFKVFFLAVLIPLLSFPFSRLWEQYAQFTQHIDMARGYIIAAMWIIPPLYGVVNWLQVKCRSYTLTSERLSEKSGIFDKVTNDLELYRIKDTAIYEPFLLRTFGVGNIILYTSDRSTPIVVIEAVTNVAALQNALREHVEHMRSVKGVREID